MRTHRLSLGVAFAITLTGAPVRAHETHRVSVDSYGGEGNGEAYGGVAVVSADGRFIAFSSDASNLVANDTNGATDIFVHDRKTRTTERVSVDSAGLEANGTSMKFNLAISADGRVVAFSSYATNLVANDTNGKEDVFVHDRVTGVTERVSVDSAAGQATGSPLFPGSSAPSISADGQVVAFTSYADNLVGGDTNMTNDVFVHDRKTGATERVSVATSGTQANYGSDASSISADGQLVAYYSYAKNLVAGDNNGDYDVFVHDRATGVTERVSVDSAGAEGNGGSYAPSLSADGQLVAFTGYATNLVSGDTNDKNDVFVHDRLTGGTERVSVDSAGAEALGNCFGHALSANGQVVVFWSDAKNLVANDTNGFGDVFLHDRTSGITERLSVDSAGVEGNSESYRPSPSADGRIVAFVSLATNLVAGDTNGLTDLFVRDDCLPATWTNYGSGFLGSYGVPSFTAQQNPVLGTTITVDVANSYAQPTAGFVFLGFQRTNFHTNRGGDLLVSPAVTLAVTFAFSADSFTGTLPDDDTLCNFVIDLQAAELDPGAALGVSFTPGLELMLGH